MSEQRPLPNPTFIEDPENKHNWIVVFTSYMRQEYASFEPIPHGKDNTVSGRRTFRSEFEDGPLKLTPDDAKTYPTVYFYDCN